MLARVDQSAARQRSEQDRDERSHFDQAVAGHDFPRSKVLRQVGVLGRAEQRRVRAHQEDAQQQDSEALGRKAPGSEQHDPEFEPLDGPHQARLVDPVRQLAAGGRQQQKRQDEHRRDQVDRGCGRHRRVGRALVGHQQGDRELEDAVVGGTEELRPEKRSEAALLQKQELSALDHRAGAPAARCALRRA